ncbi:MAG TPA: SMP-30/gluconolactonase/LRE family protein [Sphingomicrobium sp.]|nr:SMP-30/gluconolactonase/LRE family protein [Sphingomicrobium sp.]
MTGEPKLVWDLQAELGEGPVWVERDAALWFTDIKKRRIYRFDPKTDEKSSWNAPGEVGFALPAQAGGFIAGLQDGLHRFDPSGGGFERIVQVEPDKPSNRLNDGAVDPSGRLWFGTMDNGEREKSGAFYRFQRGRLSPIGVAGICITNGPAVSPDGRTLYLVDTLKGSISSCPIDEDGNAGEPVEIIRIDKSEGYPDGPSVDSEGCIWIGLYAGWEARRYSPVGELLTRIRFPVGNITKVALGGPDLKTAFATSARQKLKAEELERQPLAGALFQFDVDVPGVPCPMIVE